MVSLAGRATASGGVGSGRCLAAPPARSVAVRARAGPAPGRRHDAQPSSLGFSLRFMHQLLVLEARLSDDVLAFLERLRAEPAQPIRGAKARQHHLLGRLPCLPRKRGADERAEPDEDAPRHGFLDDLVDHFPRLALEREAVVARRLIGRAIRAEPCEAVRGRGWFHLIVPSLSPPTGLAAPSTMWLKNRCGFFAFGRLSSLRNGTLATKTAMGIGTRSSATAAPRPPKNPSERGQSTSMWSTCP